MIGLSDIELINYPVNKKQNPSWKSYSKAEQKTITNTAKLAYILKDICEVVPTTKTEKEDTLSPLNEKGVNQALKEIDKQLKSYAESI